MYFRVVTDAWLRKQAVHYFGLVALAVLIALFSACLSTESEDLAKKNPSEAVLILPSGLEKTSFSP